MFNSGMPVSGANFLDRKNHIIRFNNFINNNQHIMIKAPRRYGKTSLVLHLFDLYRYKNIYIDIKRANSLTTLAEQIINEVYTYAGIDGIVLKAKKSLSSLFKSLKTSLKIDVEIAEITIEILEKNNKNQIDELEFFLYSLDLVETIAKKQNINIKFAIDEFQDILEIADNKILDKIRSVIQHHQHITYIFLGSIESIMTHIFSKKSSPFFHFARIIELDGLDTREIKDFCAKFFTSKDIEYHKFLFNIIDYLQGHPYYTMKTLQVLYYRGLEFGKINQQSCIQALNTAFLETKPYLDEVIEKIKHKKNHYSAIFHLANNSKNSELESQALYKAYKSLENMGYIKKQERGKYIITDIFLKIFLQQNNIQPLLQEVDFIGLNVE